MRTNLLWLVLVLCSAVAFAQPPERGATVETPPYVIAELSGDAEVTANLWIPLSETLSMRQIDNGLTVLYTGPPGTTHKVQWVGTTVDWDTQKFSQEFRVFTIKIGGTTPDPGPGPGPDPQEAPFPSTGLAVMVLREASDPARLPPEQRAIFTSAKVLQWLGAHCEFFRILDDDFEGADLENLPPEVAEAYRRTLELREGDGPYLAISTGDGGYHGPLPGSIDAMMALLKKYGGDS